MASTRLAPGFRFHPTDVELIMYYLKRKVLGKKLCITAISELNIYKLDPWDLPDKSCIKSEDRQWYFFCPREKKYASGGRMNRSAETGYWKGTGKDRSILYKGRVVGMVKTLIFHQGHPPKGERTDWVMHEYRLEDQQLAEAGVPQDAFVICKLFHKDGPGARKNAQYGATFKEEEWDEKTSYCDETMTTETLSVALAGGTQLLATSSTSEPATMTTGNLSAAITGGTQLLATPSTSELTTLITGNLSVAIAGGTQFLATPSTSELTTMGGPEISSICPSHEQGPPSLHGDGVGIPSMEDVDFQSVWDFFTEEDIPPGQYDGPVIGDPSSENDLFSGLPDLSTFPTSGGSSSFSFSEMQPFQDSYLELDDLNNCDPNSYLELDDLNNCNPNSYFNDHSSTDPSLPCYGFPDFGAGHYFSGSTQVCLQPAGTNEAPNQNSYAQ